jgi:hypothetical protein
MYKIYKKIHNFLCYMNLTKIAVGKPFLWWRVKILVLEEPFDLSPSTHNTTVQMCRECIYIVLLPREWIQGIKRMTTVYFTHGLFLICTQKILFVFTRHASRCLRDVQAISSKPPCINKVSLLYLLGGPASCSWWQIPIHPGPQSGNNCPTP